MKFNHLLCRIFGHRWDKSNRYTQPCKRCKAMRMIYINWPRYIAGWNDSITYRIINEPKEWVAGCRSLKRNI